VVLLAVLATSPLHAQETVTLRGQLIDALTGAPVATADVRLADLDLRTTTDSVGRFFIARVPVGDHALTVRRIGYLELDTVVVAGSTPLHIRIIPAPVELEGVTAQNDFLKRRARKHALDMWWRSSRTWPIPERHFSSQEILASGIRDPLVFMREMARMSVTECFDMPGRKWCMWQPFQMSGKPRLANIRVNDRPLTGSLDSLAVWDMADIARVETFGARGERLVRVYTQDYLDELLPGPFARVQGAVTPITIVARADDDAGAGGMVHGVAVADTDAVGLTLIELLGPASERFNATRTRADGSFSLSVPGPGSYILRFMHELHGAMISPLFEVGAGERVEVRFGR
jgi:hypothetical protein